MKALNKKQRNAAIIKFILVYILAIAILAIPVFAIFKIPDSQCDINEESVISLRSKLEKCRDEKNSISRKSSISSSTKTNLERILNDYVEYSNQLQNGAEKLENVIIGENDIFDKKRVEEIEAANMVIFDTRKKIASVNEEFEKMMKGL